MCVGGMREDVVVGWGCLQGRGLMAHGDGFECCNDLALQDICWQPADLSTAAVIYEVNWSLDRPVTTIHHAVSAAHSHSVRPTAFKPHDAELHTRLDQIVVKMTNGADCGWGIEAVLVLQQDRGAELHVSV